MIKFRDILSEAWYSIQLAMPGAKANARSANYAEIIAVHVIKLALADKQNQNRNHWKTELSAYFSALSIIKRKGNKKPLKKKILYENLFEHIFIDNGVFDDSSINQQIQNFKTNNVQMKHKTINETELQIEIFYRVMCNILSVSGSYSETLLFNTIDSYL